METERSQITAISVLVSVLNKPTPRWAMILSSIVSVFTVVFALYGVKQADVANGNSAQANKLAQEANTIAHEAKDAAVESTQIALRELELNHLTPLFVLPVAYEPYVAEGNHKSKITVLVANTSQTDYANEVHVNFIIDDGAGRAGVNSKSWNETIGAEELVAVLAPGVRALHSWTPDVQPKETYVQGRYIFKLTTEVSWKSAADRCYRFSDFSELNHSAQNDRFHFNTKRQAFSEVPCVATQES